MKNTERIANLALAGLTLAPLVVKINPNVNAVLTASITVFVGCYRSIKSTTPSEIMSNQLAMRFPFDCSAWLLSLFLLLKFLSKDLVNTVFTLLSFVMGIVDLSEILLPSIKCFLPKQWNEDLKVWRFPYFTSLEIEFTKSQGIVKCSLGSFKTGAIMLVGLFFYDIFWVFFTPVMDSVGKSFDAPIKLLFLSSNSARPFAILGLGLGDIVNPGMFVALALRFDVSRGKQPQYFKSAFLGYIVGLALAIVVMNWFQAGQPALFYIVPSVIGFLAAHCIWNGDVKQILAFDVSKTAKSSEEESVREPIMNPMINEEIPIISVGPQTQKDKEWAANSPHHVEVRKSTRKRKPNPQVF